jgi:aryl-alcohol dehydrogenase-like predicted oxidoreductase
VETTFRLGGDLEVRRLGFGAMRVTGDGVWGAPRDPDGAKALLRHVVGRGVTLIDTADSYGPDVSEELIADALHPYPDGLVIATKGGFARSGPGRWSADCRPERLRECCEGSLRRLRRERIDLYQLHTVDPDVPIEESLGALADLQRQGKIRHVGLSNVSLEELERGRRVVDVVSVQNRYNLDDRRSDDVLDACEEAGIGFLPWAPLGRGAHAALDDVSHQVGVTGAQVALAWLLCRSRVMLPIPGTSSVEHFDENMGAEDVRLSDSQFTALAA